MKGPTMRQPARRQSGFTLAELMVSVALGLMIIAGMTTLFVNNNNAQAALETASRQVENGRYAMQLMGTDLRNAGFYAEFDPTVLPAPATVPDACSVDMDEVKASLKLHVQGVDNASATALACLDDIAAGTDILVVRHANTCIAGAEDCEAVADGGPFLQASLCDNVSELNSGNPDTFFAVGTDAAALPLTRRDCETAAALRRLQVHIYYIAANNEEGDGIPTLKRAELRSDGEAAFRIVPLVEGIQNMQLEYGMDTDADGAADSYATDPATFNGCALAACAITNWSNVLATRVSLLARNTVPTAGHTDTKTYQLGYLSDGTANTVAAANDGFKRHVFQSLVNLPNPTGRKAP
ncbi:PilW family protein [Pseudoduganella sp. GCM10020061]|uniref:PilW family protein n=1 Tax=Pseudoduganella sp. GCM10020061 TaxID=3317345 RepID=UPI00362FF21D